jgi:hypothetical protein
MLRVSARTVRRLAQAGWLLHSGTRSGTWLFREADVLRLVTVRAQRAAKRRTELLALVRPRMLAAPRQPRQTSFYLAVRKAGER